MAVEKDLTDETNPQNSSDPLSGGPAPLSNGGGSGVSDASGNGPSSSANATPSGRPNIQQYLDANKGAGDTLSQGIQGRYGQNADNFNKSLDQSKSDFDTSSQPLNQKLGDDAEKQIQTSFKDPSSVLNNQDQLTQFKQLRDQGYQGDIGNLGSTFQNNENNLQNQLGQMGQTANLANSETGRFQLLNQTYGSPNYTKGQQRLDQLFLQAQPGVANNLTQGLQSQQNQAVQNYNGLDTSTQAKLAALQGLSQQRADEINSGLTSNMGDVKNTVQGQYDAMQKQYGADYDQNLKSQFANNNVDPDVLKNFGLQSGEQTWGLNGQDLLNAGQYSFNPLAAADQGGLAQAATSDQMARYNALSQLSGDKAPASIFGTATQAGNYNPVNFNQQALQGAINQKQTAVAHDDLLNTLNSMKGYDTGGLINQIQAGINNGSMTPEQANDLVNQVHQQTNASYQNAQANGGSVDWNSVANQFTPWANYWNQEYSPAAATKLNQSSADATPLPTDPGTGTIDWGKVGRPQGK